VVIDAPLSVREAGFSLHAATGTADRQVAMTAALASRPRLLVVSGPNAAGKTTSTTTLSTIGTPISCCVPPTAAW